MKTINKMIKESLAKNQCDLDSHNEVLVILKTVEGKQFNFRTFSKKVLDHRFEFTSVHGNFYLVNLQHGQNHLIGYYNSEGVDSSKFYQLDIAYSEGSEERIKKLNSIDVKKLVKFQKLLDKHFNAIRDLFGEVDIQNLDSFHNPVYYEILRSVYDDDTRNSRHIKLSDFYHVRTYNKTVSI